MFALVGATVILLLLMARVPAVKVTKDVISTTAPFRVPVIPVNVLVFVLSQLTAGGLV